MATEELGKSLTGTYTIQAGTAHLYERGVVVNGAAGDIAVRFRFPMMGRPHIPLVATTALDAGAVTFQPGGYQPETIRQLVRAALAGRIALDPTGGPATPVPLGIGPLEIVDAAARGGPVYGLPLTATLAQRQLYDIVLTGDGGTRHTVAPHAVYHRAAWSDFGLAHITDIHVARRIDSFRPTLYAIGRPEAAARMYNWNDRFRGFVRYANYLHGIGALDVILATGDLYDYQFEDDDDAGGLGNALFLRNLILGQAPGPDFPDVEELRVPIFMVPGNHDYRMNPYHLIFDIHLGGDLKRLTTFETYHMQSGDAEALENALHGGHGVPNLDIDTAARMVEVAGLRAYTECLGEAGPYVIRLGSHRIVMLDSAQDVGVLSSAIDGFRELLGLTSEDEDTFADASPNSEGVSDEELRLAADALAETPDGGLFIVGIHAPLFNPWKDEQPYFLRETQRGDQAGQDLGWLARHNGSAVLPPQDQHLRERWPLWFPGDHDHRKPSFVKRGGTKDLLDYGVSRGRGDDLVRLLAGIGSRRPADLVLSGHTHKHKEFVVTRTGTGELAFYMDFYTGNPAMYYPTRYVTGYQGQGVNGVVPTTDVTYVEVDAEATGDATPWPMPYTAKHARQLQVPPYADPLSHSPDPRAWWAAHRPLVLQTGALGPMENNQVSFSGFRLLSVKGDVIDKVHTISTDRLEANGYRLALEAAVRPNPPRFYRHIERARRDHAPEARGAPAAMNLPTLGVNDVVYRDSQGHLHELWKGAGNDRGTSDLTAVTVGGAPPAAGNSNPSLYFDGEGGNLLTLYRADDGHVHSLYWSTSAVGHDPLTGSVGAPKADGNPIGYYAAAARIHHVIYRTSDGGLHELRWSGPNPVNHRNLSVMASAPPANGDPSPYLDTRRATNITVYRAKDGHVHDMYWAGDDRPADEDLSGFAHAPNAAGDPVAYYLHHVDLHQAVYRGVDTHIHELYWSGTAPVQWWDLSMRSGAPPADSDPVVYYSAGTNTKHVIYRGTDNQIHEITWGAAPALSPGRQPDWRWCNRCQGLYYGGNVAGSKCPTGGTHTPPGQSGSANYILPHGTPINATSQDNWRWCNKCQGLYYGGNVAGSKCPTGGTHTPPGQSSSANYILPLG